MVTQSRLPVKDVLRAAVGEVPRPLAWLYGFVGRVRPGTAKETVRARLYEAMERGEVARVAPGVYVAARGEARLVVVEGDAWEALRCLPEDSIDALVTDPPGKFGREWAGTGTTRPHRALGGRTYEQPELDRAFLAEAFRVLKKRKPWNTLSRRRRERAAWPEGGAACALRVPLENLTTRGPVQALIRLAEEVGFVFYGEVVVALDRIGMGYHAGRDKGSKWLLFHAGSRNGVLWDLGMPNVLAARRVNNPAREGSRLHEAEKDPDEVVPLLRALLRPGEVVLDCFAGSGAWVPRALEMGVHVLAVERQAEWAEAVAEGRRALRRE